MYRFEFQKMQRRMNSVRRCNVKMSCVEMNGLRWNSMKMSGMKRAVVKMNSVRMNITEKPKRAISSNVLCGSSV